MTFSPSSTMVVKRKTIRSDAGKVKRRWYVLRDSEEALKTLEEKWVSIQMHTGWKLELCYKPDEDHTKCVDPAVSQPRESVELSHGVSTVPTDIRSQHDHTSDSPDLASPAPELSPFLEK